MKLDNENSKALGRLVKQTNMNAQVINVIYTGFLQIRPSEWHFEVNADEIKQKTAGEDDYYELDLTLSLCDSELNPVRMFNDQIEYTATLDTEGTGTVIVKDEKGDYYDNNYPSENGNKNYITFVEGVGKIKMLFKGAFTAGSDVFTLNVGSETSKFFGVTISQPLSIMTQFMGGPYDPDEGRN